VADFDGRWAGLEEAVFPGVDGYCEGLGGGKGCPVQEVGGGGVVEGGVAPAVNRSLSIRGIGSRYSPVHMIHSINLLVHNRSTLRTIQPRSRNINITKGYILPIRKKRRVVFQFNKSVEVAIQSCGDVRLYAVYVR
jgi:hypothetical protein